MMPTRADTIIGTMIFQKMPLQMTAVPAARYAPAEVRFVPIDYDRPLRTLLGYHTRAVSPAVEALLGMTKLVVAA